MKTNKIFGSLVYLVMIAPLAFLAFVYPKLPQQVALHFGLDGKPDRYGDKSELILGQCILFAVALGTYLLISNLDKIDPKRMAKMNQGATKKMAVAVVILLSGVSIMITASSINSATNIEKLLLPLLGLFFAYMGNLMYSVKPNYFVGIRTPWALENEDTWRKTHMLASKLWVGGGLLICVAGLILPPAAAFITLISMTVIMCIIPAVFSYTYYKKVKTSNKN